MPKGCQFDHRLSFRRLPLGAFGKQDQDYDHDVFNSAGYTLARPHFGLENGVHLNLLEQSHFRTPFQPTLLSGFFPGSGYRSRWGGPNQMSEMGQFRLANTIFFRWSPTHMTLDCIATGVFQEKREADTPFTVPPVSLIRYARRQKYVDSITFKTVENLRHDINEMLLNLGDDLKRTGLINAFWDQRYDGRTKLASTPKREPDIHPTLHCSRSGLFCEASRSSPKAKLEQEISTSRSLAT